MAIDKNADFTPSIPDSDVVPTKLPYNPRGGFKFWAQKVIPLVYDDSLSYYEVLCKVVNYLNNVIQNVDNLNESVNSTNQSFETLKGYVNTTKDTLINTYNELQDYVNTYFDNLDVQEEINEKLDAMADSGELTNLLAPFIPDLVTRWLNNHVTPTSPIIDNTLSISGAGADAKVTGDKITELKEDLSESVGNLKSAISDIEDDVADIAINGEYTELNNANVLPDPTMSLGKWGYTQGAIVVTSKEGSLSKAIKYTKTGSSTGYFGIVVPLSSLSDGVTYRFAFNSEEQASFRMQIRDNNTGNYGSTNKFLVDNALMTNRDNNHYHYYDWTYDASDITSGYSYIQIDIKLTFGIDDHATFYEPFFGLASGDTDYSHTYYIGKYDEVLEPINLFDGEYINNYYYNIGSMTPANGYNCAEPQYLEAGDYLCIINKQYYSNSLTNKVFTLAGDSTSGGGVESIPVELLQEMSILGITHGLYKFTVVADGYIGINIGYGEYDPKEFMIVKGSTVADYPVSYRYNFEPYDVVKEPTKLNESMMAQVSPIYGKKVAVNGDSICAGAGELGGFMKPIAGHNNMDCTNIGVSGATLAYGTTYPDAGNNRHWVCTSIKDMPANYDYYIFEGGVNDYVNNVPVGSLTTGFPVKGAVDDNIDNTTITGAMEYACRDLVTLFAGKKCGFVFVHGIFGLTGGYANWHTQFKPAMISALKKWGVPYIDLEEEVPPLNLIPSLKSVYTAGGDGWHPNKAGYEAFYTDKIEAWMKTL